MRTAGLPSFVIREAFLSKIHHSFDMTTYELSSRLKSLTESHREVSQLITKLSKLSPRSDQEDQIDRVELSTEIHESLKVLEEDFELFKQEAEDITKSSVAARRREPDTDRERLQLITQIERLGEDLKVYYKLISHATMLYGG
jgi:hypothetical protein